jgi:UDP-N-acetylglucosamine 2-epimerase (non-hydrolysing)
MKVMLVGGARPNWPKIAPLYRAVEREGMRPYVLDMSQHWTPALAQEMREDLGLPDPDDALTPYQGARSHARMTAEMMLEVEAKIWFSHPSIVVVVGDVNSTLACALVVSKMKDSEGRRPMLVHVEAGLRSGDRSMPEEINRVLTDHLSDALYASEPSAMKHLEDERLAVSRDIFYAGNVMVDSLLRVVEKVEQHKDIVVTLHREDSVADQPFVLSTLSNLSKLAVVTNKVVRIIAHPALMAVVERLGGVSEYPRLHLEPAYRYASFIRLIGGASLVITDSGGLQEETSVLGVPCLTLRNTTERPSTLRSTNRLIGRNPNAIVSEALYWMSVPMQRRLPKGWDGDAATRIVRTFPEMFDRLKTRGKFWAS